MQTQLGQKDLIVNSLNSYLAGTRLSMDQVAKKWEVSTAMLSQIKNGKKRAGIDLALKILRESGTDVETRQEWLEQRYKDESEEFSLVQDEIQQHKIEKKLQNDFCGMLEENPILLDIFLDIALSEDAGVSWNSIFKNYGEHGVEMTSALTDSKIVTYRDNKFYINQENVTFVTNEESSFGIVKAIIEMQRTRKKRGQFKGELQYDVTDISKEAYDELIDLNKEYVKKVRTLLEENEMHRLIGGVRVVCQSLVSLVKGSLCLLLALGMFGNMAMAGGVRGGSSDKALGGITGGSSNISTTVRKPRDFRGAFGREFTYEQAFLNLPVKFSERADAINAAVEINKMLENGDVPKELTHRFHQYRNDDCSTSNHQARMEMKKGKIKPIGFKVSEYFDGEGNAIFQIKADYYIPCLKKE